ncbi:class II glutamine amidotransferase [Actinosynnema sp. NPDC047251]|uniref:Glutamine amidotransferase n=1 Tax=Saccharothrix espanaensis (strain ATCC 51144 / DSM 44229 / JCM 9112 / NBRC 15066 / NRRL 15764) TaxID=1179773 RepID=K0JXX8_SACES|nr:class II glutamine amidotransferase [Saccharothrix espanaensis]CCH30996.1 Glutamine amidotransferase [Saccharothrix espanaensis DSM 44229]
MCRLFGLSAAPLRVRATFWLLEAPDSLARQSRREPDGTGLGWFDADGTPRVDKQPIAAYADERFAGDARERESTTFLAHVRYASTGGLDPRNTHPFEQHGRLFAHNGVVGDLPRLDAELGDHRDLVAGGTDSERLFALITKHAEALGDVGEGIAAAARWVADTLPVYAINLVLTTPTELWALRYPDTHDLYVLHRDPHGRHLEHASAAGRIRVRSGAPAEHPAVVVATERMDDNPGWQPLLPGELLHVDGGLGTSRRTVVDHPPRHPLSLSALGAHAAASQR